MIIRTFATSIRKYAPIRHTSTGRKFTARKHAIFVPPQHRATSVRTGRYPYQPILCVFSMIKKFTEFPGK